MGRCRRPVVLRTEHHGAVRARGRVRRPHRPRRQALRSADRAADEVRDGGQSEHRQGDRYRSADADPAARRRGDRVRRHRLVAMSIRRDHYFPNTEPLATNEMRIIALGTGRPFVRRAQANCSWLIELGNGDKFIMDFGSGSQVNFTALEIPHQDVTAYFATHLHADHVGDFGQIWIGSWAGGRVKPLLVYGPSGPEPKYGIEHFVRRQMESFAWD